MRSLCSGLIVLLSVWGTAWPQSAQTGATTEKAIAALENQWLQAQKTNDPKLLEPLLADKFVSTDTDGSMLDKAGLLADSKSRHYSSAENESVRVTVFGDTAIATGAFRGRGADGAGKPFDEHERWTDTWVKMPGGKWQCVATHTSTIAK
jgi:ketosteroid isomerase-like protein